MDIHDSNYQEKREAKQARYEELAAKNHKLANQEFEQAIKMGEVIPFGQPILVGHHSEKADRNYRKKIERKMDKSIETGKKAKYYDERVRSMTFNTDIRTDDPDALILLEAKIVKLQEEHARIKALPKKPRDYSFSEIDMRSCHLSSLSTKIRAAKKRIKTIKKLEAMPDIDETIGNIRLYTEDGRLRIDFGFKPDDGIRKQIKGNGFRWSPYNEVWQSYINEWNLKFARNLLKRITDFSTRKCPNCDKEQSVYWELWTCDKNNEGLIPPPEPHGNEIHGTTTCEDHYCGPLTETIDDNIINREYVWTHEVHPRCRVCDSLIGD